MVKTLLSLSTGVAMVAVGLIPAVWATETATTNVEAEDSIAIAVDNNEPFGSLNGVATADTTLTVTDTTDNTGQTVTAGTAGCGSCSTVLVTLTSNSIGGGKVLFHGSGAGGNELQHSSGTPTVANTGLVAMDDVVAGTLNACSAVATTDQGAGFRAMSSGETNSDTDTTMVYASTASSPGPGNNFAATLAQKFGDGSNAANTFYCEADTSAGQIATTDEYNENGQDLELDFWIGLLASATLKTGDYVAQFTLTPMSNPI